MNRSGGNISIVSLCDSDGDDDVRFLGIHEKIIPVITLSDDEILDGKQGINFQTDIQIQKNINFFLNDEIRTEQNSRHRESKRKASIEGECSTEGPDKRSRLKVVANEAHISKRQAIVGTSMTTSRHKGRSDNIHLKQRMQVQNEKGVKYQKDLKVSREYSKHSEVHRKHSAPEIRNEELQITPVKENARMKTKSHGENLCKKNDLYSEIVRLRPSTQNQSQGNTMIISKELFTLYKKLYSNNILNESSTTAKESTSLVIDKKNLNENLSSIIAQLTRMLESNPGHRTENEGHGNDDDITIEILDKTSTYLGRETTNECSQIAGKSSSGTITDISSSYLESEKEKSNSNTQIQVLPPSSMASGIEMNSRSEGQLLPVGMTITDCDKVMYAVPLLRLPVQKQIVYFSPEYIEAFLTKVRRSFNVEKFLHANPDPFTYFRREKNNQNKYSDECLGLMYLKTKYRRIPFPDIAHIFKKSKFNLTLSCDELDAWTLSKKRKCRRIGVGCGCMKPHELSMPFVHEISFLENKREIENYLKLKRKEKASAFQMAKVRGELYRCGHCGVSDLLIEDMASCNSSHLFCKVCIRHAVDTKLGGCENPFTCLYKECQWMFSMEMLKKAVKPVIFSSLLHIQHLKEMELAQIKLLETCPYCGFADIPHREDLLFRCLNLDCMKETCRICKGLNHSPFPCNGKMTSQLEIPHTETSRSEHTLNQLYGSVDVQQPNPCVQQPNSYVQPPNPYMQQPNPYVQQPPNPCVQQPLGQNEQFFQ